MSGPWFISKVEEGASVGNRHTSSTLVQYLAPDDVSCEIAQLKASLQASGISFVAALSHSQ